MEFWGLEVKPGQTVKCEPEDDRFLHLSQAALGESKKGSDNAVMYVKTDDQKLVIGTLSADKFPQIQFDLVFEKEFELSHTSKTASVFFSGYKVSQPPEEDEMDFDSEEVEDEEEEEKIIPVPKANGKVQGMENVQKKGKTIPSASKSKAVVNDDDDDDETDEDDSGDEGLSPEDDDDDDSSDDDSSEDDEDESDEEETPKKPETGKKRAAEIVLKTPASDKKAKIATPSGQKTGDKKGVHVATPHPAKQASKTPVNDKAKEKSPKSGGGSVSCKSCNKTFNSDMALQSHSKAKHPTK
ncbi:histone deacetylase HDT2-like isoform X2 [Oryza brachyantha]|uniref:C2H2-type domain-containing protein n=1 Tax=Oryza brachyantha TaxID=4533 RepID=J3MAF3_ORYBR|nr:histone deacetylase HDT2-like isoform X2 [Oryza brachyantha]